MLQAKASFWQRCTTGWLIPTKFSEASKCIRKVENHLSMVIQYWVSGWNPSNSGSNSWTIKLCSWILETKAALVLNIVSSDGHDIWPCLTAIWSHPASAHPAWHCIT
jgi:hypothetical protein